MAKDKISDYSSTANSNTDIAGINIDEGCAPSGINDAIRTLMAQLKNFQTGTGGDSFNGPVGSTTASTGAFTTLSATGVASFAAGSASAPAITRTGDTNTGIFFPAADTIAFAEGGTETMRLDSAGNMGLGVTPSAWLSDYRVQQIGITSSVYGRVATNETGLTQNYYRDTSGAFKYIGNGFAAAYVQLSGGGHGWFNGANNSSGAGASLTLTQAMTLDASGNLGIGTTSPAAKFEVYNSSVSATFAANTLSTWRVAQIRNDGTSNSNNAAGIAFVGRTDVQPAGIVGIQATTGGGAASLAFLTVSGNVTSESARIDSSGNLLVGTTTTSGITNGASANAHNFLSFEGNINAQRNNGACFYASKASGYTNSEFHSFYVNGSGVGSITTTGSATAYNTSSDYRLKNITGAVTGAEAKDFIMSLQPKQGTWKSDGSKFVGFLAHEFQEVSPSSVTGEKDAVDSDGNPVMQAMQASSSEVMANLIAHIQNLETRLAALENQ
jgi:hypothetical protein